MESITTLSESLSQTTQSSSNQEDENTNIEVKYKAIVRPEKIIQNIAPILISCEEEDIQPYLSNANPTYKIEFHFLYDDGSRLNFIPVAQIKLLYNDQLKVEKILQRRKAATAGHSIFKGGYGLTRIEVLVENTVIDYIVNSVIKLLKERRDIFLDDDFENRYRRQYIRVDQDYSKIDVTMYDKIPGSRVVDVTNMMKTEKASASGIGRLRVRLIRIINPKYPIRWNLRFYIDKLEEEEYNKVDTPPLKVEA